MHASTGCSAPILLRGAFSKESGAQNERPVGRVRVRKLVVVVFAQVHMSADQDAHHQPYLWSELAAYSVQRRAVGICHSLKNIRHNAPVGLSAEEAEVSEHAGSMITPLCRLFPPPCFSLKQERVPIGRRLYALKRKRRQQECLDHHATQPRTCHRPRSIFAGRSVAALMKASHRV